MNLCIYEIMQSVFINFTPFPFQNPTQLSFYQLITFPPSNLIYIEFGIKCFEYI